MKMINNVLAKLSPKKPYNPTLILEDKEKKTPPKSATQKESSKQTTQGNNMLTSNFTPNEHKNNNLVAKPFGNTGEPKPTTTNIKSVDGITTAKPAQNNESDEFGEFHSTIDQIGNVETETNEINKDDTIKGVSTVELERQLEEAVKKQEEQKKKELEEKKKIEDENEKALQDLAQKQQNNLLALSGRVEKLEKKNQDNLTAQLSSVDDKKEEKKKKRQQEREERQKRSDQLSKEMKEVDVNLEKKRKELEEKVKKETIEIKNDRNRAMFPTLNLNKEENNKVGQKNEINTNEQEKLNDQQKSELQRIAEEKVKNMHKENFKSLFPENDIFNSDMKTDNKKSSTQNQNLQESVEQEKLKNQQNSVEQNKKVEEEKALQEKRQKQINDLNALSSRLDVIEKKHQENKKNDEKKNDDNKNDDNKNNDNKNNDNKNNEKKKDEGKPTVVKSSQVEKNEQPIDLYAGLKDAADKLIAEWTKKDKAEEKRLIAATNKMLNQVETLEANNKLLNKTNVQAVASYAKDLDVIMKEYETTIKNSKGWKHAGKTLVKLVGAVIFAAVGFALGVGIGFAIGFGLGIWTGPGAFVTAAMGAATGGLAALTVVDAVTVTAAGGIVSSLTVGGLGTFGMFKNTKAQNEAYQLSKQAKTNFAVRVK